MSRLLLPSYTCVCRHIQKARNFNSHNWQARSRLQCTSLGSQSWYRIASKSSSQPLTEEPVRQRSLITLASEDVQPAAAAGRSRQYPDEPRVGVGVVMLRNGPEKGDGSRYAEVLLVRRAKAPEIGKWTVPGGSLELGETMVECAIREALEETGMHLKHDPERAHAAEQAVGGLSDMLEMPTPYAAADVITHEDSGRLSFHYAIVEVAALLWDPYAELKPGGDVDAAQWKEVASLSEMKDLTKNSAKICMEAAKRFARALLQ